MLLRLSILVALFSLGSVFAADKHLFILSGQSNMARMSPEPFMAKVAEAFGEGNVFFVKEAQGGQPISRWDKQWATPEGEEAPKAIGDIYDKMMKKVHATILKQPVGGSRVVTNKPHFGPFATISFIWMQGERNANMKDVAVYGDSLKRVVGQIAADLHREDINVVIGRLSDCRMKRQGWVKMRELQVALAEENARWEWVDCDDLNDGIVRSDGTVQNNDLHYSREGYTLLAERFAAKAIGLIQANASTQAE